MYKHIKEKQGPSEPWIRSQDTCVLIPSISCVFLDNPLNLSNSALLFVKLSYWIKSPRFLLGQEIWETSCHCPLPAVLQTWLILLATMYGNQENSPEIPCTGFLFRGGEGQSYRRGSSSWLTWVTQSSVSSKVRLISYGPGPSP